MYVQHTKHTHTPETMSDDAKMMALVAALINVRVNGFPQTRSAFFSVTALQPYAALFQTDGRAGRLSVAAEGCS